MANYTSLEEMKDRLGAVASGLDLVLVLAIDAAEAAVEDPGFGCGRRFTADTVATARVFESCGNYVYVDDISSTSGLIVADTAGTTYTAYQLEPLNGIGPNGRPWPYTKIRLATQYFAYPTYAGQATVIVTAKWGWPAVPNPVRDAVRILASDLFGMRNNQFGLAFTDMAAVRIRENATVVKLLHTYVRTGNTIGVA